VVSFTPQPLYPPQGKSPWRPLDRRWGEPQSCSGRGGVDNEIYAYLWYDSLRTQRVVAAKLARLTHKVAIKLHLVAESCTICSSRSKRLVRKLLDTPSYMLTFKVCHESYVSIIKRILNPVKGKGKVVPCLTKHHAMKTYWGVEI
jgi:hypothetical protein